MNIETPDRTPSIRQTPPGDTDKVSLILSSTEVVDRELLNKVKSIPCEWISSFERCNEVISLIQWANYSTIVAVCRQLEYESEPYWEDGRNRYFTWLQVAIYERLWLLWYQVESSKTQHYMTDAWKQRIEIPQRYTKL